MTHDLGAPSGIRGTAVHTPPTDRVVLLGSVVDEYVITPRTGDGPLYRPVHVTAVAIGADTYCIVYRLNRTTLGYLRQAGLPGAMAGELIAARRMFHVPVGAVPERWEQARTVVHTLVRGAVEGTLPLVDGPNARALWETATDTVCRAVAAGPTVGAPV